MHNVQQYDLSATLSNRSNAEKRGTGKNHKRTKKQLLDELAAMRPAYEEMKSAMAGIAQREKRYRQFVDNIADACFEINLEGKLDFCNEAFIRMYGYPKDVFTNIGLLERHPSREEGLKVWRMYYELYRTNASAQMMEYDIRRSDGEVRTLESLVSLIHNTHGTITGFRGISRDVTARKKMETIQKRYQTFLENVEDGCSEVTLDGRSIFANPAALRILGYSAEEFRQIDYRLFTPPEEVDKIVQSFLEVHRTGKPIKVHCRSIIRKDGKRRILEESVSPLKNEAGQRRGFVTIFRDVTERRQMETEWERSKNFVENVADACFEYNLDGKCTFANDACLKLFGYSREDFMKLDRHERHSTREEARMIFKMYEEMIRNTVPIRMMEHPIRRKDGNIRTVENLVSLIYDPDGEIIGFRGIGRDITARKKMEAERERYRNFIENVEDICFEYDLTGHCIFCNEAVYAQLGYKREAFKQTPWRNTIQSQEDIQRTLDIYRKVFSTGIPMNHFSVGLRHKNGGTRIHDVSVSLIRDEEGNPAGFRGISRDVTERTLMEEEQKRLTDRLEHAKKMEAIGTLAGGIAHDFNNLLTGIQGYTTMLLLETSPCHPYYERLKIIESQTKSGADLTRQLLGYARGGRFEVKPTNLNDLVNQFATLFGRTKKEIAIRKTFTPDLKNVEVDQGQIEQVLLNLFVNAWQAMPGGGTLYLETGNVILGNSDTQSHNVPAGPYVKLSVTDTGVGMDAQTRSRIFEPFFTTKEMGHGTGLGLASVYGIIKGHHGLIKVYSEPGHGSTFNIYLPSSDKKDIPLNKPDRKIKQGGETIFIVDDEIIIADITSEMLTSLGYRTFAAHSGEEALNIYRGKAHEIDLVILDIIMPGIGGGVTFDRLKTLNPGVKVLLSSGYSMNGDTEKIMQKGAKAFLQKPFSLADLTEKIRGILDE